MTVFLDSAADQAELLEGDEVLEINEEVVTDRNRGYCMLLINGSLQKNGKLNLYIKRDPAKSECTVYSSKSQSFLYKLNYNFQFAVKSAVKIYVGICQLSIVLDKFLRPKLQTHSNSF